MFRSLNSTEGRIQRQDSEREDQEKGQEDDDNDVLLRCGGEIHCWHVLQFYHDSLTHCGTIAAAAKVFHITPLSLSGLDTYARVLFGGSHSSRCFARRSTNID